MCGRGALRLPDRISRYDPITPGRVDDVDLKLRGRLVVGDLHQLLGGHLEKHRRCIVSNASNFFLFGEIRSDPIPVYRTPNVTKVLRAMSVVRGVGSQVEDGAPPFEDTADGAYAHVPVLVRRRKYLRYAASAVLGDRTEKLAFG